MRETDARISEEVPPGYTVVPLASRWLFVRDKAERMAMRGFDSRCAEALRPALMPAPALPDDRPPISTEARYARSRGRYGRRRGDDDHLTQNAKRPGGNRGVGILGAARETAGISTRLIPWPLPAHQAPRLHGWFAVAVVCASITPTMGDARP